ncbi:SdpI family protein [Levilactobacillus tangyuanensis]|uniref:SdpI family protein n=1 Tax=Levilactobacillus tangyuanensis TaxID=2486021 RepID=A0ABW1TMA9_9LACO|nr:SdpI family protein [Levilactobacillus tangyuanensis]
MFKTKVSAKWQWGIRLLNLGLLALIDLFQRLSVRFGTIQPARSVTSLLWFTLIALVAISLPMIIPSSLRERLAERVQTELPFDLNVVLFLYSLVFLIWPRALLTTRQPHQVGVIAMIVLSIIAAILPYVPRNRLVGIRIPWTYNSPVIWHKVNVLGGQVMLVVSLLSLLAFGINQSWFIVILTIGTVVLVGTTIWYGYELAK